MIEKEVIGAFQSNIRFKEICVASLCQFYPLEDRQISKFKQVLNFERLSKNNRIKWNIDLFENIKDFYNWKDLWNLHSLELDLDFFRKYHDQIDFSSIYLNRSVDWSNQLLDEFEDKWDFDKLSMKPILGSARNIRKYAERCDWRRISRNKNLKLDDDLLEQFLDRWNWNELCANPAFKISKDGIEKYRAYIDWRALSENPSMLPFILTYSNEYAWDWSSFVRNPALVFSDKLIDFLVVRIKKEFNHFRFQDEIKENWAKTKIVQSYSRSINPNLDVIRNSKLAPFIPYGDLIKISPELLTEEELVDYWNFDHCRTIIGYRVMQQFPLSYIKENWDSFSEYHRCVFRHGRIDREFLDENIQKDDWFHLAFNENFEWTIDFLIENLDRFESNYGLSQNRKIFDTLFPDVTQNEISNLLNNY
ncbi:tryptophan repeat-containing protein [Pontixanthobacter gangjinensis]|uniref:Uncharacterized protein n=1 Tax=Christiangramia aestuarii TaxID=1028746 RepID=A0A7K1LMM1_9FLAO|nr:hypothetical protein [Christiangramia aestuarii]MUP42055.1 hypothetical protein [Christiangramia aestuarii]